MTDLANLSQEQLDQLAERVSQRQRERANPLNPQKAIPESPNSTSSQIATRMELRRREAEEAARRREAALREARERFETKEGRRLAEVAPRVAKLQREITDLRREAEPLEAKLAPLARAMSEKRREIADLSTPRVWDGTLPPDLAEQVKETK